MILGVLGFEFESSNKGCEALSYSLMPLLDNIPKDITIIVFNIHDTLGEIPKLYPRMKFINCPIKMKRLNFWLKYISYLNKCDYILDITHGDSFSDIYGMKWFKKTCLLKKLAITVNNKLILMPQTYGPYLTEKSKKIAKRIIEESFAVYSRDEKSKEYIEKSLKIKKKVFTTADLAFMLPYEKYQLPHDKINIGINISGLLWNLENDTINKIKLNVNYRRYCERLIELLHDSNRYDIYLIPHVLCDNREGEDYYDNDSFAINELKKKYPYCICPGNFETVLDVKNFISSLDILIAARMHASIGAFSSGICSIPFSYSRKFAGVYGDLQYDYVLDGERLETEKAISVTIEYINDYKHISSVSRKCMEKVKRENDNFIKNLYQCMGVNIGEGNIA